MAIPKIKSGYLIYHTYSSYNALDSQLYLLDFATQERICISDYLPVDVVNAMNGHINATEDKIVFMGMSNGEWEIFLFDIPSRNVEQLTTYGRNEDPKFAPTGNKIVYKKGIWDSGLACMTYAIVEYDLDTGTEATEITPYTVVEVGMPYYDSTMENIYYVYHGADKQTINKVNINTLMIDVVVDDVVNPYYPIIRGDFMTFSYDYSTDKKENLVARFNLKTGERTLSKFNSEDYNVSDAYIIDSSYTVVSCTKVHNNYDLWLINFDTGEAIPMDSYGVNTTDKQELGSCLSSIVFEEQKQAVPSDLFKRGLTDVLDKAKGYTDAKERTILWADYQALSEEEKNNGTLYDIPDMPVKEEEEIPAEPGIQHITTLEELGLSVGTNTSEIFLKMPDNSLFEFGVTGYTTITDAPDANGFLRIRKIDSANFDIQFRSSSNRESRANRLYLCQLHGGDGTGRSWARVCTSKEKDVALTNWDISITDKFAVYTVANNTYSVKNAICVFNISLECKVANTGSTVNVKINLPVPVANVTARIMGTTGTSSIQVNISKSDGSMSINGGAKGTIYEGQLVYILKNS